MPSTKFLGWTYPDENVDPHFDILESFYKRQDISVYSLLNTANNIIIPPSSVSWNNLTKTLTWSGYFEIPIMSTGFTFKIFNGPDNLTPSITFNDGERMVITIPSSISENTTSYFRKTNGAVTVSDGLITIGFCRGDKFFANFPQHISASISGDPLGYTPSGSMVSPVIVNPLAGIPVLSSQRQIIFVKSNGGAQTIIFNPQLAVGTIIGAECMLVGTSDVDYISLFDGNGLALNGGVDLRSNKTITLVWTGTVWLENGRR